MYPTVLDSIGLNVFSTPPLISVFITLIRDTLIVLDSSARPIKEQKSPIKEQKRPIKRPIKRHTDSVG